MNVTTTLLGILGFFLFIIGFILILAGVGIITIKQYVEITRGTKAFIAGIVIVLLGALLLFPEARASLSSTSSTAPIADADAPLSPQVMPNTTTEPPTELNSQVQTTPDLTQQTSPTVTQSLSSVSSIRVCGDNEGAFKDGLNTNNPLFWRPEGFTSGWLSSDPATIVLPDGTSETLNNQFVLVIQDLEFVQVQGVNMANGKANTWGCWYTANDFVEQDAMQDMCNRKQNGNFGRLYTVSTKGIEELGTTQTVSCP